MLYTKLQQHAHEEICLQLLITICLKHNVLFKCNVDFRLASTFHRVKPATVVETTLLIWSLQHVRNTSIQNGVYRLRHIFSPSK